LCEIPYHSSITVALGYDRAGFGRPLDGFGFLVPRVERRLLTACTWVGTKFAHRVADNRVLLRAFVGAGTDESLLARSDDSLAASVREELRDIMGATETPVFARVHRWRRAMAQYTVGHQRRLDEITARLAALPGLHLAGNAYIGIGIPDCIRTAQLAAERISGAAQTQASLPGHK
jgi:oxygen-dependent protoporphyrinogen oxidase